MPAELRVLHSADAELLELADVPEPASGELFIQAFVGLVGQPGLDGYGVEIVTLDNLHRRAIAGGPLIGRGLLVVDRIRMVKVAAYIERYVTGVQGDTWNDVGPQLEQLGPYESEDYVPSGTEPPARTVPVSCCAWWSAGRGRVGWR